MTVTAQSNGFSDHRMIMKDGEQIGQALKFSNGKWGAFDLNDKRLTAEQFKNPRGVARWFLEQST